MGAAHLAGYEARDGPGIAFGRRNAKLGLQQDTIGGRPVWILPNTSGLNAHHTPADFARLFAEARAYTPPPCADPV